MWWKRKSYGSRRRCAGDRERSNEAGRQLPGGTRDWQMLCPQVDKLARMERRCRDAVAVGKFRSLFLRAQKGLACFCPGALAARDVCRRRWKSDLSFLRVEKRGVVADGRLEG